VKPKRKVHSSPEKYAAARKEFVGALMANLLHSLKNNGYVPQDLRRDCAELQLMWDKVSQLRMINPLTIAELKKEFELL